MTWQKLFDYYEQGQIVPREFEWSVFMYLDEGNIQDFMDKAPADCNPTRTKNGARCLLLAWSGDKKIQSRRWNDVEKA